jgi:hypothetical protein
MQNPPTRVRNTSRRRRTLLHVRRGYAIERLLVGLGRFCLEVNCTAIVVSINLPLRICVGRFSKREASAEADAVPKAGDLLLQFVMNYAAMVNY